MIGLYADTEFCPHTLPAQASILLKYLLQNASSPDIAYRLSSDKEYLRACIDDQLQLIDRYPEFFPVWLLWGFFFVFILDSDLQNKISAYLISI